VVRGQTLVNDTCDFGWVAAWASEMGDADTLSGLLIHADRHFAPSWLGGLDPAGAGAEAPGRVVVGRLAGRGDWTLRRDGQVVANGTNGSVSGAETGRGTDGLAVRGIDGGVELRIPPGQAADYTLAASR